MKKIIALILILVMSLTMFTGCVRPYNTPEFVTIEPHQTAFLIPLVGDTTAQASFESEEMLMQGLAGSNNHEANKQLLHCIKEAVDLLEWLENLNASFEAKDLEGMRKAKSDYENRHTKGV